MLILIVLQAGMDTTRALGAITEHNFVNPGSTSFRTALVCCDQVSQGMRAVRLIRARSDRVYMKHRVYCSGTCPHRTRQSHVHPANTPHANMRLRTHSKANTNCLWLLRIIRASASACSASEFQSPQSSGHGPPRCRWLHRLLRLLPGHIPAFQCIKRFATRAHYDLDGLAVQWLGHHPRDRYRKSGLRFLVVLPGPPWVVMLRSWRRANGFSEVHALCCVFVGEVHTKLWACVPGTPGPGDLVCTGPPRYSRVCNQHKAPTLDFRSSSKAWKRSSQGRSVFRT